MLSSCRQIIKSSHSIVYRRLNSQSFKGRNIGRSSTIIFTGVLTSLGSSTLALCESSSNQSNSNNDNDDSDQDFIAKIKSKLEDFHIEDNATLNSIATSLGGQISSALASGIPTDISYGFFAGYFSGLALKKIGKVASITLGASFLALQTLAYNGYIDVHHEKLQKQVEGILDRNNDGVVDSEDLKGMLDDVKKVAGFKLDDDSTNKKLYASGGGFTMGFYGGLRSG